MYMGSKPGKKKIKPLTIQESKECYICGFKYPITYVMYHQDRCGVRVDGKKLLPENDKSRRIE